MAYKIDVDSSDIVKATRASNRLEKEVRDLQKAYNENRITFSQYISGLNQISGRLTKLNGDYDKARSQVFSYSSSLKTADKVTDQLTSSTNRLANAQQRQNSLFGVGGKGMNRFGVVAQQTGYQIGDFAVQVTSGTNALVAMSQQGTQILSIFGAGGAIAGAAFAIGTALVMPLLRGVSAADELQQALKSAREEAGDLAGELDRAARGLENAAEAAFAANVREAQAELNRLTRLQEQAGPRGGAAFTGDIASAERRLQAAQDELDTYRRNLDIQAAIEASNERQNNQAERNASITRQILELQQQARQVYNETYQSQQNTNQLLQAELDYGKNSVQYLRIKNEIERESLEQSLRRQGLEQSQIDILLSQVDAYNQMKVEAAQVATETERAAENAQLLASVDISTGILAALDAAKTLADNLGIAYSTALAIARIGGGGASGPDEARAQLYEQGRIGGVLQNVTSTLNVGPDSRSGGGSSGGSGMSDAQRAAEQAEEFIKNLREEMSRRRELLDLTQRQAQLQEEIWRIEDGLGDARDNYSDEFIQNLAEQNIALQRQEEELERIRQRNEDLANTIGTEFESAIMSVIDGTSSMEDAFRQMAANIIAELYQVLVLQQLIGSFSGGKTSGIMGFVGSMFRESGGSVDAGKPYIVGERGPELIVPKHSGTVMNAQQTDKSMSGGSVVVNQHFSISANGDESIRKIVRMEAPKIAQLSKSAVLDAKQRGGSYAKGFK